MNGEFEPSPGCPRPRRGTNRRSITYAPPSSLSPSPPGPPGPERRRSSTPRPQTRLATVDAFRDSLGALNPPAPVNAPGGRRQIDRDAASGAVADPNPFPGAFFNGESAPRARGIEFRETGDTTGFLLSSDPADAGPGHPATPEFGFDSGFTPFSPKRLFAPIGGTTFDVLFFDPTDRTTPAGTTGLGMVFTDIEEEGSTVMHFFDIHDNPLGSIEIGVTGNAGLASAGLLRDAPDIFRVAITSGSLALLGNGQTGTGADSVVMDDFIFGEPTAIGVAPVPLPAAAWMRLAGVCSRVAFGRRRGMA